LCMCVCVFALRNRTISPYFSHSLYSHSQPLTQPQTLPLFECTHTQGMTAPRGRPLPSRATLSSALSSRAPASSSLTARVLPLPLMPHSVSAWTVWTLGATVPAKLPAQAHATSSQRTFPRSTASTGWARTKSTATQLWAQTARSTGTHLEPVQRLEHTKLS
jgi:hypothetical protein